MSIKNRQSPKVSVIIPVYNCEVYVAEAIESVLSQDYPNIELIIVNDGSTDDSISILKSYHAKAKNIVLLTKENGGAAEARNAGLEISTGEFVAFLDADDVWLPGKLTLQVQYLLKNVDIDMVYSSWIRVENNDLSSTIHNIESSLKKDRHTVSVIKPDSGWIYHHLLLDCIVHTITVLMRKSLVAKLGGFDANLRLGEDYTYWLKASRITEIVKLNFVGAIYRLHGDNITEKTQIVNNEYTVVDWAVKKWGTIGPDGSKTNIKKLRLRLAKLCFEFGYEQYWHGDMYKAYESFRQCTHHRMFWTKNIVYLILSLIRHNILRR
ncbi:MAG: glycosyltransferase family 2 protein [Thiohalomonadales bacterium]